MGLTASGNLESLADAGYTRAQIDAFFRDLSAKTGASYESGDAEALINKLMGGSGYIRQLGGDPLKAFAEFEQQYARRGGSNAGVAGVDSSTLNVGTTAAALVNIAPSTTAPRPTSSLSNTGVVKPPAVVAQVTTMGASLPASETPTVGPTGLAYQDDPINYATMQVHPSYGYNNGLPSGIYGPAGGGSMPAAVGAPAGGMDQTTLYLLIGAGVLVAYFLLVK